MDNLKIIVEGSNLSGKSSIVAELEKKFIHSVVVTLHGYYHPRLIEGLGNKPSEILKYHDNRLNCFLSVFKNVCAEELIFNRFHLTASVYLKTFLNIEEHFFDIEEKLNQLRVYLILADFNDEALEKRLSERQKQNKEAPWGDENFSKIKLKRDLYRQFFKESKIKNKILIENSKLAAAEAIKKINFT